MWWPDSEPDFLSALHNYFFVLRGNHRTRVSDIIIKTVAWTRPGAVTRIKYRLAKEAKALNKGERSTINSGEYSWGVFLDDFALAITMISKWQHGERNF